MMPEFEFTCWVMVHLDNLTKHSSVRSVLTSVYSVSNGVF